MHQLGEFESTEAFIKPIRMNLKHSKVGRNDPCPCGSGLKYKKCCADKAEAALPPDLAEVYARKHRIRVKTPADIEAIRRAGRLVVATLELVAPRLRPGLATDEINTWVHEFTLQNGAVPAPLNYRGYPKSVCVSVNEVICHGIPGAGCCRTGTSSTWTSPPSSTGITPTRTRPISWAAPGPTRARSWRWRASACAGGWPW